MLQQLAVSLQLSLLNSPSLSLSLAQSLLLLLLQSLGGVGYYSCLAPTLGLGHGQCLIAVDAAAAGCAAASAAVAAAVAVSVAACPRHSYCIHLSSCGISYCSSQKRRILRCKRVRQGGGVGEERGEGGRGTVRSPSQTWLIKPATKESRNSETTTLQQDKWEEGERREGGRTRPG